MELPALNSSTVFMFVAVFFVISVFLLNVFMGHRRLINSTRGKIIAVFHQPGGGETEELCDVQGVYVFRGQEKKASFFQTKQDIGTAREVYVLDVAGVSHEELRKTVDSTREMVAVAVGDATEVVEELKRTSSMDRRKRKELQDTVVAIKSEIDKAFHTQWDVLVAKSMASRPHKMYPIIMPPNKAGLFQSQVSLPVAHFIEGRTLEVDPITAAIGKFEADPLYNAAMVGSIVDQRLLELAAWFSSYIDKLEQQLIKMVNPTILYLFMGVLVLLGLVGAYFGFTDHSKISQMAKDIEEYMALIPKG